MRRRSSEAEVGEAALARRSCRDQIGRGLYSVLRRNLPNTPLKLRTTRCRESIAEHKFSEMRRFHIVLLQTTRMSTIV